MTSTVPLSAKRKREEDESSNPATTEPASAPRVIGPTVPHHLQSDNTPSDSEEKNPAEEEHSDGDDDDDSDDDFGPQLPPAAGTQAAKRNEDARWAEIDNKATEKAASKPVERDEWMVVPPTKGSWASGTQGAPLQSRKFVSGRSARTSAATEGGPASAWTEDPAQKRLRLENEVLGIQPAQTKAKAEKKPQPARNNEITAKKLKDTRVFFLCLLNFIQS